MIAFFDMDRTVLRINSGTAWVRFLRRRGEISRLRMVRALGWALQYRLSILDMEALSEKLVADLAGDAETDMVAKCAVWYRDEIRHTIARDAERAIARHRAAGDRVVLLTSATPYIARPLAETLGLDGVICSRLEVVGGRFTGRIVKPICYGAGKVHLAETWASERAVELGRTSFYTDSYTDLPMLERVGRPIAVNPDPRLLREARRRGWPVEKWT
ncbi:MAG TPA: HAD family hydrolase [Haliangiales bacterium]|nr:HAD family hydrolase [Haliangiales bacterium]